jgi:antirestriction protein ArdC
MKVNEVITNKILGAIGQGIIPWNRPWQSLDVQSVDGHRYRGINRMLLSWASYSDPRFVTFNKCHELGGQVKGKEHGWPIVFWKYSNHDKDDKTAIKSAPFMRYSTVFNVADQCEGLIEKLKPLKSVIDFKPIDRAEEIINGYSTSPRIIHGGNQAGYTPNNDEIHMPNRDMFHSGEAYYSTLFHEAIHSTGHETRLNRDVKNWFGTEKYSKEELVAEIGSAFLRAEAHIDNEDTEINTQAYIDSWVSRLSNDPNMVISAASKAQRAFDYIMGIKWDKEEPEATE